MSRRWRELLKRRTSRGNTIRTIMERLIVQENGCCTWSGSKNDRGYGKVRYQGQDRYVHRILYEHFVGVSDTAIGKIWRGESYGYLFQRQEDL